jgi:hypothetical protein
MRTKEIIQMTNNKTNNNTPVAVVSQDQYNARLIEVKTDMSETQMLLALLDNSMRELNSGISRAEGILEESKEWFDGLTDGDNTWF